MPQNLQPGDAYSPHKSYAVGEGMQQYGDLDRRGFLALTGVTVATLLGGCALPATSGDSTMFGLIGKMTAAPGQRDALIAILLEGSDSMPGCLSYIVAKDTKDADSIWVSEVWDSAESHKASLQLPSVKAAITKGKPLIAGFGDFNVTEPVGGIGLKK